MVIGGNTFGAPCLKLILVVGHAPSGSDSNVESWWKATSHAIPASHRAWPVIHLVDANARVGSVISSAVGPYGAALENDSGMCFHQFLLDNNLFVPQTFEEYHVGAHNTWEHGRGVRARLDYICLDRMFQHPELRTAVLDDLDLSIQRLDHFGVRADNPQFETKTKHRQRVICLNTLH